MHCVIAKGTVTECTSAVCKAKTHFIKQSPLELRGRLLKDAYSTHTCKKSKAAQHYGLSRFLTQKWYKDPVQASLAATSGWQRCPPTNISAYCNAVQKNILINSLLTIRAELKSLVRLCFSAALFNFSCNFICYAEQKV